ncbi:MAG: peptide deformylase [Thermoanaerobacterales bacterium]|nr:peptide deformylase [Bacillota bacterium]MDI6907880.1 peptide deformylase [Thermoanaerobacterales bacterium]
MAVCQIVKYPNDVLREKARPVKAVTLQVKRLLNNMFDTMRAAGGVGLAAPQIGVSKRLIVIEMNDERLALVNPEITAFAGRDAGTEGCLSIPGVWGEVERAAQVEVRGLDQDGRAVTVRAEGYLARALQHEIDHLDGILFIDRATKIGRDKAI